jgi:LysM repeat protein
MNQRFSAPARVFAVTALVCGALVLVVVVATSLGGDDDGGGGSRSPGVQMTTQGDDGGKVPKSYVVQNGDTLTSIAHKTGVPVSRIEELNPGVDPQILVSGEKLKLR